MPYDYSVSLIWRALPAWPPYTDADGHEWKLAPNGYWWLHHGGMWHQAGSQAAGDVLGVMVPAFNPAGITLSEGHRLLAAAREQLANPIQVPPAVISYSEGGSGAYPSPVTLSGTGSISAIPAPNIPPDFVPILPGDGSCAGCHLDDGPLYDGGLCRYCWMLANVRVDAPDVLAAADVAELEPAQPLRQTLIAAAAIVFLLLTLWLGLALVLTVIGYR